jgi:glycosyltransferase involved in cell wall biosynthesis
VFCNSAYTEDLVRARARRTWRVANPIRAEFFSTPSSIARSGKCLLVNVGVISERKRQLELLQLAGELHRKGLEFELHFIGHADPRFPYAKEFLERIKPAEKAGYAHYLGGKSTRELIECFDLAQGMIHFPSEEAFGLVVAESLARDLKLFGSKLGGIVEICSGVNSAELFEAEDWAGLAKAIEKWIEAGYPRAQGAAVCMHERYHPQIIMRRHVEIYEEMLSRP